jgi:hypothetical protein
LANQQTRSSLDLTTISPTEWLICDPVEVERTGIGILGLIEARYGKFEVLAFTEPSRRAYFDTFDAAFEFVAAHHPRPVR